MTFPKFLHKHIVVLFPVIPLVAARGYIVLVPVPMAMEISAVAVHSRIEEVCLAYHDPV